MDTVVKLVLGLALTVVIALFIAFPVMWLWNWLMPEIFGLVEITFWQGLGLAVLSGFLFNRSSSTSKD